MVSVITDSSSNISQEEGLKTGVTVMPLTIIFGNEEYKDGVDITLKEFYEKLVSRKDFPHTAQLGEQQIEEAVKAALARGDEAIIMPISSALSGSYERCVQVAQKYENVYVYDTKCTTVMLKMLVEEACRYRELPAAEIIKKLDAFRPKIKLYAIPDTLEYLGKGGRISKAEAKLGEIFKIKPVITVNLKGKVELVSKQFGLNKSINYIAGLIKKEEIDFTRDVYLLYSMNDNNSLALAKKTGGIYSLKTDICPVIGAHIGPNAAGVVFAEK